MTTPHNVILIGYRASGKTEVGRRLASQLRWTFIDTDDVIEKQHEACIRDVIERLGEPEFRRIETDVITKLQLHSPTVLSIGGGAIESPAIRKHLPSMGTVIWLDAAPSALWERIQKDPRSAERRPALTPMEPEQEIRHHVQERFPYYAELASVCLDTTRTTPDRAAQLIRRQILSRLPIDRT